MMNCIRSFEPTEAKSTTRNSSSSWKSSDGTSIIVPSTTFSGRPWPWRVEMVQLARDDRLGALELDHLRHHREHQPELAARPPP